MVVNIDINYCEIFLCKNLTTNYKLQAGQTDLDYSLREGGYAMPGVCLLFECLLATLRKNTEQVFMKILLQMYLWTGKLIKFWKSFASGSGSGSRKFL